MNKKMFRFVSLYSLVIVLVVIVLTTLAVILSASKSTSRQTQTLSTSSVSDLKVQDGASGGLPSVSNDGSGNASSSGTVTLQAGQATPVPAGVSYPCASCPDASSTTDVMICSDYCISPEPEPTPVPPTSPYPQCDPCRGNTYGASSSMVMCPMIACRYPL